MEFLVGSWRVAQPQWSKWPVKHDCAEIGEGHGIRYDRKTAQGDREHNIADASGLLLLGRESRPPFFTLAVQIVTSPPTVRGAQAPIAFRLRWRRKARRDRGSKGQTAAGRSGRPSAGP